MNQLEINAYINGEELQVKLSINADDRPSIQDVKSLRDEINRLLEKEERYEDR